MVRYSVVIFILIVGIGCKPGKKRVAFFEDYSFLEGRGENQIIPTEIVNDNPFIIVKYPDSVYQEIFVSDSIKRNIRVIKVFKRKNINIYHFLFIEIFPGAREDLFMAYGRDSTLKEYTFGLQLPNEKHSIISSFNLFSSKENKVYFFLADASDTIDFVNKIWIFDKQYLISRTDSLLNVKKNDVFTLNKWLNLHK